MSIDIEKTKVKIQNDITAIKLCILDKENEIQNLYQRVDELKAEIIDHNYDINKLNQMLIFDFNYLNKSIQYEV